MTASTGDLAQIQTLLSEYESPSEETIQTILVTAAKSGQLGIINFLLDQHATLPLNEEIFRSAVNTGSIPIIKVLLARDPDPDIINLPFDRRGSALIVACMGRQPTEYLQFLLEAGADPNMDPDAAAYPLALVASLYTDPAAVDVLLKHGARPEGTGALACAAQKGNEDMVRSLLESGARPEAEAKALCVYNTGSPLHGAVGHGHVGVVELLLRYGADITAVDHTGLTAIDIAKQMDSDGVDVSNILEILGRHNSNRLSD